MYVAVYESQVNGMYMYNTDSMHKWWAIRIGVIWLSGRLCRCVQIHSTELQKEQN
jgi:hypothetical protein